MAKRKQRNPIGKTAAKIKAKKKADTKAAEKRLLSFDFSKRKKKR